MSRIKLKDLQRDINKLKIENENRKQEINNNTNQIQVLTDGRIIEMIQETNAPFSNKPRYSYEEIGNATGRSSGYVSNLARDNGLSRRNNLRTVK